MISLNRLKKLIPAVILMAVASVPAAGGEDRSIRVRGVLHVNTNVSSGSYGPGEVVDAALREDAGAVFLTENLYPVLEYGLYPFRGILKRVEKRPGLLSGGAREYAEMVRELDDKYPDVSVIMAAEVAPFYYWTGSPFEKGGLVLNDWDRQFFITGMAPEDYASIPTVSTGGFTRFSWKSLSVTIPLALILTGIMSLRKKHPRHYVPDPLSWLIIAGGALLFLMMFPFKEVEIDQYGGSRGAAPYQKVIDHVRERGGLIFWSAPEAFTDRSIHPRVKFKSPSSAALMEQTRGYDGFFCFYEGYRSVGGPGKIWDGLLLEYCSGKRDRPVWTSGETAFHDESISGGKRMSDVQTVFFVKENDPSSVLDAMRNGRMYAVRRSERAELALEKFMVSSPEGESAVMGEELKSRGPVTVSFRIGWEGAPAGDVSVKLVRGGDTLKEFRLSQPGTVSFSDDLYIPGNKVYYRLDVREKYPGMLFSNPIFVRFISDECNAAGDMDSGDRNPVGQQGRSPGDGSRRPGRGAG